MRAIEVYEYINSIAPFSTAMPIDNAGFLIGDPQCEISGILVCMDLTMEVIREALINNANLVVTHHPVIFNPKKNFLADDVCYMAATTGLNVISAHTNWDKALDGINYTLAEKLGIYNVRVAKTTDEITLIGELKEALDCDVFAAIIKAEMGISPRRNTVNRMIKNVALCGGSGGSDIFELVENGEEIEAFLTADVKHHEFLYAASKDIVMYDGGHYATEIPGVIKLAEKLALYFTDIAVRIANEYDGTVID